MQRNEPICDVRVYLLLLITRKMHETEKLLRVLGQRNGSSSRICPPSPSAFVLKGELSLVDGRKILRTWTYFELRNFTADWTVIKSYGQCEDWHNSVTKCKISTSTSLIFTLGTRLMATLKARQTCDRDASWLVNPPSKTLSLQEKIPWEGEFTIRSDL